jgi:hypothetical protein
MNATSGDNLARAAEALGASRLLDGRWAYFDDGMYRWYVVSALSLAHYCDYTDEAGANDGVGDDAYSLWCAATTAQEMPKGWDPDVKDLTDEAIGRWRDVAGQAGDLIVVAICTLALGEHVDLELEIADYKKICKLLGLPSLDLSEEEMAHFDGEVIRQATVDHSLVDKARALVWMWMIEG